jgi:hypothetical protein
MATEKTPILGPAVGGGIVAVGTQLADVLTNDLLIPENVPLLSWFATVGACLVVALCLLLFPSWFTGLLQEDPLALRPGTRASKAHWRRRLLLGLVFGLTAVALTCFGFVHSRYVLPQRHPESGAISGYCLVGLSLTEEMHAFIADEYSGDASAFLHDDGCSRVPEVWHGYGRTLAYLWICYAVSVCGFALLVALGGTVVQGGVRRGKLSSPKKTRKADTPVGGPAP